MSEMQTDIGVLKSEVKALTGLITNINTKMDILLSMQVQLVQLQERHEHTKEQLDAADSRIASVHKLAVDTSTTMTKYHSFVAGVILTGSVLFGFIQWYVVSQINEIKRLNASVQLIERRLDAIGSKTWFSTPKSKGDDR